MIKVMVEPRSTKTNSSTWATRDPFAKQLTALNVDFNR